MKKQNALIDYTHFGENEIVDTGRLIESEMTTNAATFPDIPVGIPVLKGQLDNYELIKSAPVYPNKTEDLGAARLLINTTLHDNGIYVNTVAKGDLVKLGLSGYPISKLPGPVGDLPAPVSVEIKNAGPLSFLFNIDTVEHAVGYLIALTPVTNPELDPNLWRIVWSSRHTRTVGGNERGKEYKFAVCAVGTTDNINWLTSGTTLFAQ
jgi:hypothetical protein